MKVVVLAAGFATRLYPLTRNCPKPLLDIGGKPVLTRLLDRVLALEGLDEVVVVTNDRFREAFEDWAAGYRTAVPLRVLSDGTDTNENRLGAVADMALGMESLADHDAPVLVVAGDNLIDFDLGPYAERFGQEQRTLLLVREIPTPVPPGRFSEVSVAENGTIAGFREKPDDPQSNLSAVCLYFFPGSIRSELAQYASENHNLDAPGYFLEWLHGHHPMGAALIAGTFHDIGNLETLESARTAFTTDD
ncbi:MAG: nucleoside-diphosphate-sugar pyrophosphorylase [Planctomycetes bacterium]|jgi:glucose-1-phosphate thymidylyltransferase|nr:nucleoside-diphosphate-sugar pyrophosphorylase [Planctomycetota bacterium]HJM58204.1 nucleotidyltransferase family protein [Planctomycetota bacterium]